MIATSNIPLNVPFKEKDEAKSHGARWNPAAKHWYIPEGVDDAPFAKWLDGAPAAPVAKPETQSDSSLPKNADIDDINAMLRDAFEDNEPDPAM
jgi:hypothetical protein